MGLLARALSFRSSPENPTTSLSDPADWLFDAFGIVPTDAGISVSVDSALRFSAVYACLNILAQGIAQVPWDVMRFDNDLREVATDRYEHWLLHNEPNGKMSSFTFRTTLMANAAGRGNFYAELVRDGSNKVRSIQPLTYSPVQVFEHPTKDRLVYEVVRRNGVRERIDGGDVVHIPAISLTGECGLSPISQARQGIGLGLAAEQAGASLFANGIRSNGFLTSENKITADQQKRLSAVWQAFWGGSRNSGKTPILEGGLKWNPMSMTPEDAQYIATREFQISDIARMFRVPSQMLGVKDAAPTYASAEQFFKAFVNLTLAPWVASIEQEFNRKLFPNDSSLYCKLDLRGLMRGDASARGEFYHKLFQVGALSPNDIRELEDMNPVDGGDKYYIQLNQKATTEPTNATDTTPDKSKPSDDEAARSVHARWLADIRSRIAKWEKRDNLDKIAEAYMPVLNSLCVAYRLANPQRAETFARDLAADPPPIQAARTVIDQFIQEAQ